MNTPPPEEPGKRWETDRVEAFSDAVLAIAITLLVLDIRIAPADVDHLGSALTHQWPEYLAYVTSFLTVGSVWIAHHGLFARLRFVDPGLLRINLLLLMATAFLPFPTSVLADALHHSRDTERIAVVFYGAAAFVIDLLLSAAVRYADSRPDLAAAPIDGPRSRLASRQGWRAWLSVVLYVLAIAVGIFTFPRVAVAAYLAVAVRGALVRGGEGQLSLRFRRSTTS